MKKLPCKSNDSLIDIWILFRYMIIALHVGIATIGTFIIWYTQSSFLGISLMNASHTVLTYNQFANWDQCSTCKDFAVAPFTAGTHTFTFDHDPCEFFQSTKVKVKTLSLSALATIEIFNSSNALSEE